MEEHTNINKDGHYGMVKIDTDAAALAIYNDGEIEERIPTPQLEFPNFSEHILEQKVETMHRFFDRLGEKAIKLFSIVEDELDRIVILGSSPIKYHFKEGEYLGELDSMAIVADTTPLGKHPLSPHIDSDKTIAEQLDSQSHPNK